MPHSRIIETGRGISKLIVAVCCVLWGAPLHTSPLASRNPPANAVDRPQDYTRLYRASLHAFSLIRSGVAVNDAATGIVHPASHLRDALLAGTGGQRRDLTGGWYNAGDYGKWTMMAAISVSYMLHLASLQQAAGKAADPALLDEAVWGLAWLLMMQDADGGVRHKVDSGYAFAWGLPPQADPNPRVATAATSLDTADFAAVMYQAERFCTPSNPPLAADYKTAADRAWRWLQVHPQQSGNDPFYPGHDPRHEEMWAASERILSVPGHVAEARLQGEIRRVQAHEVSWGNPSALGLFSLALSKRATPVTRKLASRALLQAADRLLRLSASQPYGVALGPNEYTWGSVETVLHRAALLLMADQIAPRKAFRKTALLQMGYVLGNNPLQHSFITGFGQNSVQHPYHWTWMSLHKLMPGWAVGGPNGSPVGADEPLRHLQQSGVPASMCYLDLCSREGSWASNEGQISENAALVFDSEIVSRDSEP